MGTCAATALFSLWPAPSFQGRRFFPQAIGRHTTSRVPERAKAQTWANPGAWGATALPRRRFVALLAPG